MRAPSRNEALFPYAEVCTPLPMGVGTFSRTGWRSLTATAPSSSAQDAYQHRKRILTSGAFAARTREPPPSTAEPFLVAEPFPLVGPAREAAVLHMPSSPLDISIMLGKVCRDVKRGGIHAQYPHAGPAGRVPGRHAQEPGSHDPRDQDLGRDGQDRYPEAAVRLRTAR